MRDFSWGGYVRVLRVDWAESSLLYPRLSPPRPGEAFSSLGHLSLWDGLTYPGTVGGIQSIQRRVYDSWNFFGTKDHRKTEKLGNITMQEKMLDFFSCCSVKFVFKTKSNLTWFPIKTHTSCLGLWFNSVFLSTDWAFFISLFILKYLGSQITVPGGS